MDLKQAYSQSPSLRQPAASASQVLVRADLNVPLDKNQKITDDTRIRAAIPTLKYLTENGAKVLLTSHLVSPAPEPTEVRLFKLQGM